MNWQENKTWSDKFLPEIKSILGPIFINESTEEEDKNHNTDLMVLTLKSIRIACRIRRNEYLASFSDEFTIRSKVTYGKTELAKIIEGWGRLYILWIC